jgi:hypothetical protein
MFTILARYFQLLAHIAVATASLLIVLRVYAVITHDDALEGKC